MKLYTALLSYYKNLFELVDCFHFNSSLAQSTYNQYLDIHNQEVIPIVHSDIKDRRKIRVFDNSNVRLGFIGNTTDYKGFPLLKKTLIKLFNDNIINWNLSVWGGSRSYDNDCKKILYKGKYETNQLTSVFSTIDLLIVPSIWDETFSLITLEALSFGVPVLVSSTVGAKDIVRRYDPFFIFETPKELENILSSILKDTSSLIKYNQNIVSSSWSYSMEQHVKEINQLYCKILGK